MLYVCMSLDGTVDAVQDKHLDVRAVWGAELCRSLWLIICLHLRQHMFGSRRFL
jgi:hypothetical protein